MRPGVRAPDFRLPSTGGNVSLGQMLAGGHRLVLAFYFEDGTPSCQTELTMLKDAHEMITEFRGRVLAVSADSIESHREFGARLGGLPFPLASDADLVVGRAYDVVDESDPRRLRRATFVIDSDEMVVLAIPRLQPNNLAPFEAIFRALGAEV